MEQNNTNTDIAQTQEMVVDTQQLLVGTVQTAESLALKFKRNSLGLLDSVTYKYAEDGSINWRDMADLQFVYINKDNFLKRKEAVPDDSEKAKQKDSDLIIGLAALKKLAFIRGFTSVKYKPVLVGNEYSGVTCQINWIGNYETDMQPVIFEDCACANLYNTGELVQSYLLEMATNRAFSRCIRNFLKILHWEVKLQSG